MKAPADIYALLSNSKKSRAAYRKAAQAFHAQRLAIACIERARLSSMAEPRPKMSFAMLSSNLAPAQSITSKSIWRYVALG